jgi:hypothetical protein
MTKYIYNKKKTLQYFVQLSLEPGGLLTLLCSPPLKCPVTVCPFVHLKEKIGLISWATLIRIARVSINCAPREVYHPMEGIIKKNVNKSVMLL